jgi:hypothetical protein
LENSLGLPEPDATVFRSAFEADALPRGQDCRLMDLPEGTRIVVLDVTETVQARHRDDPPRVAE